MEENQNQFDVIVEEINNRVYVTVFFDWNNSQVYRGDFVSLEKDRIYLGDWGDKIYHTSVYLGNYSYEIKCEHKYVRLTDIVKI